MSIRKQTALDTDWLERAVLILVSWAPIDKYWWTNSFPCSIPLHSHRRKLFIFNISLQVISNNFPRETFHPDHRVNDDEIWIPNKNARYRIDEGRKVEIILMEIVCQFFQTELGSRRIWDFAIILNFNKIEWTKESIRSQLKG